MAGVEGGLLRIAEADQDQAGQQPPLAAVDRRRADGFALAGVLEHRVLGRQALLRRVELGGLPIGVLERLERADRFVLVHVGGRILERLDPVAGEHRRVLLGAALGRGDHRAARPLEGGNGAAAGARRVDDQLTPGGDPVAQLGELCSRDVRADEIELVFDAVERAVADERQDEVVLGLGVVRDLSQDLRQTRPRRRRAGQGVDVDVGAGGSSAACRDRWPRS